MIVIDAISKKFWVGPWELLYADDMVVTAAVIFTRMCHLRLRPRKMWCKRPSMQSKSFHHHHHHLQILLWRPSTGAQEHLTTQITIKRSIKYITRSSADADNRLDAFSGQSRSTNMVPFHMLHMVSYCAIVTLFLRHAVFTIFVFKKIHDLEMGVKGHSRSLRVVSFDRLCMVSY